MEETLVVEETLTIQEETPIAEEEITTKQNISKQQHRFICKKCQRNITINTDKICSNSIKEKMHSCSTDILTYPIPTPPEEIENLETT